MRYWVEGRSSSRLSSNSGAWFVLISPFMLVLELFWIREVKTSHNPVPPAFLCPVGLSRHRRQNI